jgi:hypothetical protein
MDPPVPGWVWVTPSRDHREPFIGYVPGHLFVFIPSPFWEGGGWLVYFGKWDTLL